MQLSLREAGLRYQLPPDVRRWWEERRHQNVFRIPARRVMTPEELVQLLRETDERSESCV